MASLVKSAFAGMMCLVLPSCGARVPQLNEVWEPADINDELVYRIKASIYCELVTAARIYNREDYSKRGKPAKQLPADWGAQMTLTLTADESAAVNPSGSYNRNIHPARDPVAPGQSVGQSLTLPFSLQASTQAVRTDTYYSFYTVPELIRERYVDTTCHEYDRSTNQLKDLDRSGTSYLLSGDVGILSWMNGALLANNAIPASNPPKSKNLEVLQYSIKFVVITSGSFNPMWKLAAVSTGIGGLPLLSGNRTRTHQLLLTLGPTETVQGRPTPVNQASILHSNGQLGQVLDATPRSGFGLFR